ncbi:mechanosensitive ion channel [Flammeovirgaceae bacterium SG7u.111]|nr:mechanosensitive ion channel [Flammeovirgaceae bacterium SG7u.132]WPO38041.1 mechanosensitive ion channel [Flammeovirgaceae bacterium SG7u.111]
MDEYIRSVTSEFIGFLVNVGMDKALANWVGEFAMLSILLFISFLAYGIVWRIMRYVLLPVIKRSNTKFDDLLLKHRFFRKVSYLLPIYLLYYFTDDTITIKLLIKGITAFLELLFVVIIVMVVNSVISTISDYYKRYEISKDHPMEAIFQVMKIIVYAIGFMVAIGVLFDRDIGSLFLSLGALSAVLLLIFKDTILGLVGGLQLIFNKMVAIGDWITVPKYGADGDVEEINLISVKVRNWDKTIVTVPTYGLISDSFQNWRGMQDSGGRRIKRAIYIDMESIRFCDDEMLEKFSKIVVLRPYLMGKENELNEYNKKFEVDLSSKVNGRRQTNVGVFRAYLKAYLNNRQDIRKDMTFLVRQLEPKEKGLPIEIYVFTNTTAWAEYEEIQADIFDHIFSVIPEFGLRVYQSPSNAGFDKLGAAFAKGNA